jgi:polyphosphate kinase
LEDEEMIERLYDASNAGVKVRIIVRGICCLVPQFKGYSENIKAVSIVDRFLEHARVFIFETDTTPDIYLSSADWMERNLSHRVETAFPIFDESLKNIILDVINIQLKDNTKARIVHPTLNNYKKSSAELAHRSQIETYFYFKNQ